MDNNLIHTAKQCRICEKYLNPNPVFSMSSKSTIILIGQAPGRIVHETGIPWNDKSGDNLRNWLGVDKFAFYDTQKFGIMPMGLCYPGSNKSGDLPPRKECAPLWHHQLLDEVAEVKLTILIGQYAQNYYLKEKTKNTLTHTVMNFQDYLPNYFVLPHPSPRNNIWMAKNDWFEKKVLPELKQIVKEILI